MLKEIKIELTNKCARNCKHCSSRATNNSLEVKELDFTKVVKIIKEAKKLNVKNIVFTGGEPLLYERLNDLIKIASDLGIDTTIYTFQYRNDATLKQHRDLINLGLKKIVYSLADSLAMAVDTSIYSNKEFFDKVFRDNNAKLGFHYTVSKDSLLNMESILKQTIYEFKDTSYFDKISLLRFVPHGKGTSNMDLNKEELMVIKNFYLNCPDKDKIRLGTPWNILNIKNTPCIIADEIMIIGYDGIAYPCDSIKYFTKLGVGGNIQDNSLQEIYNSRYFQSLRKYKTDNACLNCSNYSLCKSGCIGQKIIAYYEENPDKELTLKKCISKKDPKCMR